jgi:hypothetical protein
MRYVVIGFCVFAAACAAASPTAPTSPATAPASSPIGAGIAATEAKSGSELPFKGNLQASEAVDGALHHLVGSGNGTQLGRFTYTAEITVDEETGNGAGTVTWTATNGDQIVASTTGRILVADFPNGQLTIGETQIITGGSGRFSGASGTISVERSLDLMTGVTGGPFTGTINLGH